MNFESVSGAASKLGVSPRRVRQMLAGGKLSGQRLGREWVVDPRALERVRLRRELVGRPWNASSAWALLALANGEQPDLTPVERSRAKRRLAEHGLIGLVERLRARAKPCRFYGHPAVFDRLARESEVVRSGVSAAAEYGADIVASNEFEGYVRASGIEPLVRRYALDADAEQPNVMLRVVDDEVWSYLQAAKVAPRPVVAVDLLEADDERSRRAGVELARQSPLLGNTCVKSGNTCLKW